MGHLDTSALVAIGLAFCTYCVYLGGLAAVQNTCNNGGAFALGDGFTERGTWSCYQLYSFYWFVSSYEFFLLIVAAIFAAAGVLNEFRISFAALFAVATLLYIETSRVWIPVTYQIMFESDSTSNDRVNTLIAGAIMTAVANFIVTFVVGHDKSKSEYYAAKEQLGAPAGAQAA